MRLTIAAALLLLSGCDRPAVTAAIEPDSAGARLERAAAATGLIPSAQSPVGLYASETDRVCIVPGERGYRIAATVDFDNDQGCDASGTATGRDTLAITFGTACRFDARFEGDRIVFPATLPAACDRSCHGRSTLAALSAMRLSAARSEAATMRLTNGAAPCAS